MKDAQPFLGPCTLIASTSTLPERAAGEDDFVFDIELDAETFERLDHYAGLEEMPTINLARRYIGDGLAGVMAFFLGKDPNDIRLRTAFRPEVGNGELVFSRLLHCLILYLASGRDLPVNELLTEWIALGLEAEKDMVEIEFTLPVDLADKLKAISVRRES